MLQLVDNTALQGQERSGSIRLVISIHTAGQPWEHCSEMGEGDGDVCLSKG